LKIDHIIIIISADVPSASNQKKYEKLKTEPLFARKQPGLSPPQFCHIPPERKSTKCYRNRPRATQDRAAPAKSLPAALSNEPQSGKPKHR
jgi:hypothetical protein